MHGVRSAKLDAVNTFRYLLVMVAAAVVVPTAIAVASPGSESREPSFRCLGVGVWDAPNAATPAEAVEAYVDSKAAGSGVVWSPWSEDPRSLPANVATFRPSDARAGRAQVGASVLAAVKAQSGDWSVGVACQ